MKTKKKRNECLDFGLMISQYSRLTNCKYAVVHPCTIILTIILNMALRRRSAWIQPTV